jgi:4-hydroxybenzoyl-CoA thioesterase
MKFTVQKQVRFHHCDPAGIVFYPQFFYLLHEVQEDFLAHIGFPEHKLDRRRHRRADRGPEDRIPRHVPQWRPAHDDAGTDAHRRLEHGHAVRDPRGHAGFAVRLRAHGVVVYSEVPHGKPVRIPDNMRSALMPYLKTPSGDTCLRKYNP